MIADVAIRVDASDAIGTGHIFRCLVLAQLARERGRSVVFLCRHLPDFLRDRLKQANFPVVFLGSQADAVVAGWLGVPAAVEMEQMLEALAGFERPPHTIIVDHYELDVTWESAIAACGSRILAIDDLERTHQCDILIDATVGDEGRYIAKVPKGAQRLLGPSYSLVRPEFVRWRLERRPKDGSLTRILIFYGGIDATGEVPKALRALRNVAGEMLFEVIPGRASYETTQSEARLDSRVRVLTDISDMARVTADADLVLGAGGTASWERCFVGAPTILTAVAENQRDVSIRLAATGAVDYLGAWDVVGEATIVDAFRKIRARPAALCAMGDRAYALCAGFETSRARVVDALCEMSA